MPTPKKSKKPKIYISSIDGIYIKGNHPGNYSLKDGGKRARIIQALKHNKVISASFLKNSFYRTSGSLTTEINQINLLFAVHLNLTSKGPLIISNPAGGYSLNRGEYDFVFPDD